MLIEGKSVKEIASSFFVSNQAIYNIISKNSWKSLLNLKKEKINNKIGSLLNKGYSCSYISRNVKVSKSKIYKIKNNKNNNYKVLTNWFKNKSLKIYEVSKKYEKILELDGIYIDRSDIQSVLLDLLIHTDQKNISNKDAYFYKYAPLKIKNLASKMVSRSTEELTNEDGEEIYCHSLTPEKILIMKESVY